MDLQADQVNTIVQENVERERRIVEAEAGYRSDTERGEPATWTQTRAYRLLVMTGSRTMDARHSFWDTRMWKAFERKAEVRTVSFDQGAMGAATRNRTTLGTNVNNLEWLWMVFEYQKKMIFQSVDPMIIFGRLVWFKQWWWQRSLAFTVCFWHEVKGARFFSHPISW